jgi:hypothetical protein
MGRYGYRTRDTSAKFNASLVVPDEWHKTKRKSDGAVQGFTFRSKGRELYIMLGPPQLVDKDAEVPVYRYTFSMSHTRHLTDSARMSATLGDRVFFAEGYITLFTDEPKWEYMQRRVRELVDEYNIAILRVGRVFNLPDSKFERVRDVQKGGYTALGVKMDVNPQRNQYGGDVRNAAEGVSKPEAAWEFDIRYMFKNTYDGFNRSNQANQRGYGYGGNGPVFVREDELGTEVLVNEAGGILREAAERLVSRSKEHFEYLLALAETAADEEASPKERVDAAKELEEFIKMNTYAYGKAEGYHYLAVPREPVDDVSAAVQSLITILPDVPEE